MLPRDHHRLRKYSYTSETDWYVDCMRKNLFVIKICLMCYVLCWSMAEHLYCNRTETYYMACIKHKSVFLQSCKSCLRTAVLKWWLTNTETWNMMSHYFIYQQMLFSCRPVTHIYTNPTHLLTPVPRIRNAKCPWCISEHHTFKYIIACSCVIYI